MIERQLEMSLSENRDGSETPGDLMSIKDAAEWASQHTVRNITESNIS
jgi:hypothetical protein